ncbi:hypothetical protein [Alkalicoccobacillus murimartini]|uniref:Uncharacterized protein n=1 Tax=Alkalicoccobacillus murimartini TaxID=171685 RepID=A0ABT9YNT4_9BACI|nr:hypothetical protein [Alkalicoccobacillus murimartini]MDQ0208872.1 hypothetical protein [Alkalicoccobacillus murimartini]
MTGINLFKSLMYGVLALFLVLQRNDVMIPIIDFEKLIGGVLIFVAILESGISLTLFYLQVSEDRKKTRTNDL